MANRDIIFIVNTKEKNGLYIVLCLFIMEVAILLLLLVLILLLSLLLVVVVQ